jgi:uncharacterized protein YbbC (DUF1343 family)
MPSPNVPTDQTAIVYPGTVLFEGTMLSEGRGTTRPFELLGAPWIEAEPFADRMNAVGLAGVHFRPAVFEPTFQKHCKVACGGCQIHVIDRSAFKPVAAGASLIREFVGVQPDAFTWRPPPYEYEQDQMPIDILAGNATFREQIEEQAPLDEIVGSWTPGEEEFRRIRAEYLLY